MNTKTNNSLDQPKNSDVEQLLLTIAQASTMLNIGRSTIYELIWAGQLAPVRLGRSVRFRRTDLEHFVATMTTDDAGRPKM